ncbi:MAG: hypothetical protein MUC67_07025 [Acidobacteria bacterium]|nr:hypothetical protein [Acidobacteriota bacterium]
MRLRPDGAGRTGRADAASGWRRQAEREHRDPRTRLGFTPLRFRILDTNVELDGPDDLVGPVSFAYRRFLAESHSVAAARSPQSTPAINGRPVPLVPGADPLTQVYQEFLATIQREIRGYALLHGASLVGPDGRATLISAPGGHGKTTLTLALASRGWGVLSDDYSPLELRTGLVHPYPRTAAVALHGDAPLPEAFRRLADRPDRPRLFGKSLIDFGEALGEKVVVKDPRPLGRVVLIAADLDRADPLGSPPPERMTIGAPLGEAERFEARLVEVPGVRVVGRVEGPHLASWALDVDYGLGTAAALSEVLDDPAVRFIERDRGQRPDFSRAPEARSIRRHEAALLLGRELLNRRGGDRALAGRPGGLVGLIFDLAGGLANASCWLLRPGPLDQTVDLIAGLDPEGT